MLPRGQLASDTQRFADEQLDESIMGTQKSMPSKLDTHLQELLSPHGNDTSLPTHLAEVQAPLVQPAAHLNEVSKKIKTAGAIKNSKFYDDTYLGAAPSTMRRIRGNINTVGTARRHRRVVAETGAPIGRGGLKSFKAKERSNGDVVQLRHLLAAPMLEGVNAVARKEVVASCHHAVTKSRVAGHPIPGAVACSPPSTTSASRQGTSWMTRSVQVAHHSRHRDHCSMK